MGASTQRRGDPYMQPYGLSRSKKVLAVGVTFVAVIASACSNDVDIDGTIDARVQEALAAQPTVTPQPTASPQPSPTAQLIPTPLPTSTPAPTPTPQPTSTAAPAPTLVPTATPQPTTTPAPTATTVTSSQSAVASDFYSSIRLSVVKIRAGSSFGSGWAIEDGWIITNEHVISGRTSVTVEVPRADGGVDFLIGTVRGFDTKRDLAAVQVDHEAPVLPTRVVLASDAGTPIMQLGYSVASSGGFPVVHTGVITTVIRHLGDVLSNASQRADEGGDIDGVGVVVFDADADPGDSGGPVIDFDGNVVGITFGAVVTTNSGKRVIGQQQATAIESINRVWSQLKEGTNTTAL